MFKKIAKSVVLASAIIYGSVNTPEMHNNYLRWKVGESVVKVMHVEKDGGGTGFAVKGKSGKDYIMTNHHVCKVKDSEGFVRLASPEFSKKHTTFRQVVYMDSEHDLCLIDGSGLGLSSLSIGSEQNAGEFHYAVGHPGLRPLTVSRGEFIGYTKIELLHEVENKNQCPGKIYDIPYPWNILYGKDWLCTKFFPAMMTTAFIYGGNSGSPVVDKWGRVVGVVFAGNTEQEHDNYIVPLKYVENVLKRF